MIENETSGDANGDVHDDKQEISNPGESASNFKIFWTDMNTLESHFPSLFPIPFKIIFSDQLISSRIRSRTIKLWKKSVRINYKKFEYFMRSLMEDIILYNLYHI